MSPQGTYDRSVYGGGVPQPRPVTPASRAAQQPRRVVEKWLTVEECAAEMRVSKMTVYRLIHGDELGARRIRRQFRVAESELKRYLDAAS